MRPKPNPLLFISSILVIVSMACNLFAAQTPTPQPPQPVETQPPAPTASGPVPTPPANAYAPVFAAFQPVSVNIPAKFNGGDYSLPVDLGNVQFANEIQLSDAQRQLLSNNGFVVKSPKPGEYREFYQIYENNRYNADPRPMFITTDSIYHVYHLIFDKMLRDLERDSFITILGNLTSTMLKASYQQYADLKGTPLE